MSDIFRALEISDDLWRRKIIETALSWVDTPYQHQASLKGVGSDCLGLIRGVWRELYGSEPAELPPYSVDWAERHSRESLYAAACEYLTPIQNQTAQAGDVLMFRMQRDAVCKHVAIMIDETRFCMLIGGVLSLKAILYPIGNDDGSTALHFLKLDKI